MMVHCHYCGDPVDTDARTTFQRVEGWERKRDQGGTNAIIGRQVRQSWACYTCIDRLRHGIDPAQQTLA